MKKAIWAALLAVIFVVTSMGNAFAMDRVQWLSTQNPPSSWLNQNERDTRIGFGQWIYNSLGGTNGFYSNLTTSPVTGLFVAVGPSSNFTIGSVYQYLQEETTAFGGFPSGVGPLALQPDQTQVFLQGNLAAATPNIGPLSPPGTAGQSIDYIIECQVVTQDTTNQGITVVSTSGVASQATANRDRIDTLACQSKAGTAATTGTQTPPTTDTGWICISIVAVANGTATITTGMITAAQQFTGFVQLTPTGQQTGSLDLTGPITLSTGYVPQTLTNTGAVTTTNPRIIYAHGLSLTTTGSCTNLTVCSLSAGSTVTLSNGAVLTDAAACKATVTGSTAVSIVPYNTATTGISVAVLNVSGGTITTGTSFTYSLGCIGD